MCMQNYEYQKPVIPISFIHQPFPFNYAMRIIATHSRLVHFFISTNLLPFLFLLHGQLYFPHFLSISIYAHFSQDLCFLSNILHIFHRLYDSVSSISTVKWLTRRGRCFPHHQLSLSSCSHTLIPSTCDASISQFSSSHWKNLPASCFLIIFCTLHSFIHYIA